MNQVNIYEDKETFKNVEENNTQSIYYLIENKVDFI